MVLNALRQCLIAWVKIFFTVLSIEALDDFFRLASSFFAEPGSRIDGLVLDLRKEAGAEGFKDRHPLRVVVDKISSRMQKMNRRIEFEPFEHLIDRVLEQTADEPLDFFPRPGSFLKEDLGSVDILWSSLPRF